MDACADKTADKILEKEKASEGNKARLRFVCHCTPCLRRRALGSMFRLRESRPTTEVAYEITHDSSAGCNNRPPVAARAGFRRRGSAGQTRRALHQRCRLFPARG